MMNSPWATRGFLLFWVLSALSIFAHGLQGSFLLPAGMRWIVISRIHFGVYWVLAVLATWLVVSAPQIAPWHRWTTRALTILPPLLILSWPWLPIEALHKHHPPLWVVLLQDLPALLWATALSAAIAKITGTVSAFFERSWWLLIAYRLFVHALMALQTHGRQAQESTLSEWMPFLDATMKTAMLVLLFFSWLSLRSSANGSLTSRRPDD